MADHDYADAPLWTTLNALANMPDGRAMATEFAAAIRTRTGYPGAYRAIGRLVAAGYADMVDVSGGTWLPNEWRRASITMTRYGWARWRRGSALLDVLADRRTFGMSKNGILRSARSLARHRQTP